MNRRAPLGGFWRVVSTYFRHRLLRAPFLGGGGRQPPTTAARSSSNRDALDSAQTPSKQASCSPRRPAQRRAGLPVQLQRPLRSQNPPSSSLRVSPFPHVPFPCADFARRFRRQRRLACRVRRLYLPLKHRDARTLDVTPEPLALSSSPPSTTPSTSTASRAKPCL